MKVSCSCASIHCPYCTPQYPDYPTKGWGYPVTFYPSSNKGWECPKCGTCHAPNVAKCDCAAADRQAEITAQMMAEKAGRK